MTFGEELRRARVEHGLSQRVVGEAAGLSDVHVSRIERGKVLDLGILTAFRLAAVVGLDLSFRAYPSGNPVRDVAHLKLLDRACQSLGPGAHWQGEVPLPLPGDQRAWDRVLRLAQRGLALEGETRLSDLQALQRRLLLKLRDDPSIDVLVLAIADTRNNRQIFRESGAVLREDFPLDARAVRRALAASQVPAANGIIVL